MRCNIYEYPDIFIIKTLHQLRIQWTSLSNLVKGICQTYLVVKHERYSFYIRMKTEMSITASSTVLEVVTSATRGHKQWY